MKLNTNEFGQELKKIGFDFYSGVPCSFLKSLINYAINECEYVMATNEGDAVAICAGATVGGRKSVFLCQNSGLTNATSPLTSLNHTFKIPVLGFVSLRGEDGLNDEPQHELMGKITTSMLDVMEIEWDYLSPIHAIAIEQLHHANTIIEQNKPFFFVVKKDTFESVKLNEQKAVVVSNQNIWSKHSKDLLSTRQKVLEKLTELKQANTIFIATTGITGRELYEIEDAPNNLYMVGSMGCASSFSLGLSIAQPNKEIIVIDGDGAFLMRMGSIATNAYYQPNNMFHLLLDNNAHESTGKQQTVSNNVNFVGLAKDVGYTNSYYLHNLEEVEKAINEWRTTRQLTFAYLKIIPGTKENLGRPKIKPYEVKERLISFVKGDYND